MRVGIKAFLFEQNFRNIWKWFFHQKIVASVLEHKLVLSGAWKRYVKCITSVEEPNVLSRIGNLFPRIRSGKLHFKTKDIPFIDAEFGIEVESEGKESGIEFVRLVALADKCFSELDSLSKDIVLLVDELEVFYVTREQFERDCRLIRDLIIVADEFNRQAWKSNVPIRVICAVRSEVITAVNRFGGEIGKMVEDLGIQMSWSYPGSFLGQPLLNIVTKKIVASEVLAFGESRTADVWEHYFAKKIHNLDVRRYLLEKSFWRPRDLVRLLNLARECDLSAPKFVQRQFDQQASEYAKRIWREMNEELLTIYSEKEIAALQFALNGFKRRFRYKEIKQQFENKGERNILVKQLVKKRGVDQILQDLFQCGIVGNEFELRIRGERKEVTRWVFKGDDHILPERRMMIHRSLWRYLGMGRV